MYSSQDLSTLHGFLRTTSEANLGKMLVGGKMTEVHLRMLHKIARATNETEFATHCEASTYPKVKFTPPESALKESFWATACEACAKVGLLSVAKKAA